MLSGPSLNQILRAAQQGDAAAFDMLYGHYADALFRYLCAQCGSVALAEDLLGDLWVRVVERIGRFTFPASNAELAFSGWLYRIARNLVIDQHRRQRRQLVELPEQLAADDDIQREVEQRAVHSAMQDALATLTENQREVVIMRFLEGRTSNEVAHITGRAETAVKALQHRALAMLARHLRSWRHGNYTDEE